MNHLSVILAVGALGWVLWWGRRIPLSGRRKQVVLGCRLVAVATLWLALAGWTHRRLAEVPRHLIYLVDGSASLDEAQRAWIARRIASLEAMRPKRMARAIVAFGAEPAVVSLFGADAWEDPARIQEALERAHIDPAQTNLETALLAAAGLPPPHRPDAAVAVPSGRGSVVLLSDGRETLGSVSGILGFVQRAGLVVFPSPPPPSEMVKTAWEELTVPPVVQQGAPVRLQLVLVNGSGRPKTGVVTVALHGVTIKRRRIAVRPGWQVAGVSVPAVGLGTMALEVSLAIPEEGVEERRPAYTEVEGPPRVLVVSEQRGSLPALAAALKRREIEVAVSRPAELPEEPGRLLDYDAVVFFNVPHSTLTPSQGRALRTYVEEFGGGLLTLGLGGELAKEVTTPSPIDPLLPVTFEPKGLQESKRRVCVILLVDRSASMYGPRLAATKRAAVELVKQLSPEDLVGILAFDTQPYVVAEVQPAGQVSGWLVDKLVTLRSSGGTDIYPALAAAANRLELTGATTKHIILLSDGNTPIHEQAYQALTESFRRDGTTVSTVGIGAAFVNTEYLKWLADSTGGRFHPMRHLDELPRLIAKDVQQELGKLPFTEGRFRPTRAPAAEWFAEIPEWPALRGYLTATAKPEARVELTVDGGDGDDPLLARWAVGQGRVAAFLSDADRRWAPDWIRWPAFEGVWAQVARWVMRPRLTEELFVWVDERGGESQMVIEGTLHRPEAELVAADGRGRLPLSLVQSGSWRWRAPLADVAGGWYQLVLASEGPIFTKRWVHLGTSAASQEIAGQPPRESVLRAIAASTGGAYDEPDRALVPPTTTVQVREPLLAWWLPLALVALLIEVWVRGPSMLS